MHCISLLSFIADLIFTSSQLFFITKIAQIFALVLIIAVMFTFSFGSAFAALDKSPIAAAETAGYKAIDDAATAYLSTFTYDKDGYFVSTKTTTADASNGYGYIQKTTVETEVAKVVATAKATVHQAAITADLNATDEASVKTGAATVMTTATTQVITLDFDKALVAQDAISKKAALEELGAYTFDQYSEDTDDWSVTSGWYPSNEVQVYALAGFGITTKTSAKDFVKAVVKTTTAAVEATTLSTGSGSATAKANLAVYAANTSTAKNIIKGHLRTDAENWYIAPVPTAEELAADTTVAAAKKAGIEKMQAALKAKAVEIRETLQDVVDNESTKSKPDTDKVAAYKAAIAALDAKIAAAEEVYTGMINAETTTAAVKSKVEAIKADIAALGTGYPIVYNATKGTCTIERLDRFVKITEDVDALEAYAKQVVALIDRTANPYFDEAAVNDALEAEIENLYTVDGYTLATAKTNIDKAASIKDALINLKARYSRNVENLAGAAAVQIGTKSYAVWADPSVYEGAQKDAYKANIAKTLAAIEAATSYDEIKTAYLAGVKANEDFITIAQHNTDWAAGGKLKKEYDKNYATELDRYAEYAFNKLDLRDTYSKVNTYSLPTLKADVKEIVEEAYTVAEIPTKVAEAKAYLDALKSDATLNAEKAAVDAKIAALKTPVTVADKAQILEAKKAYEEYAAQPGANEAGYNLTLKNAVENLAKLEMKAIVDEITKYEDAGVTVADEEAIKAIEAALDEYEDNYEAQLDSTDFGYNVNVASTTSAYTRQAALAGELSTAKLEDLAKKCAALPINPESAADRAQIAEARDAFNALSIYEKDRFIAGYNLYYDKLSQVEEFAELDAKAYVQDLSIKARSTKTSKGVKVTIKADVQTLLDAGYKVEYKFYRSTKSNKNFGTAKVTKTTNTYLNTSGVKGTKYYYKAKLVVKNAAGEVVATTPLTQCLYATRVF